jgi:hypothetical protein
MASRTGELQGFAAQAVLSHFARRIATAVLQWDRRDSNATLDQLDPQTRREYERIGESIALMSDRQSMRVALYAAADDMVKGGIDRLEPRHRIAAVALFTRAYQAMKRQLMSTAHHEKAALMRALVERDQAAGIDTQPVIETSSVDLATVDTAPEVH